MLFTDITSIFRPLTDLKFITILYELLGLTYAVLNPAEIACV